MEVMKLLKEQTRANHDSVEKYAHSHRIMDGSLTLEQYKELVLKHFCFHRLLEGLASRVLTPEQAAKLDFENRKKTALLRKDLEVLGISEQDISVNFDNITYSINSFEELLGALYVAEGSTLGGAVIKRKLLQNPETAGVPMHFYGCYGENIGTMWKSFIMNVVMAADSQEKSMTMVNKAKETFEFFEYILKNARTELKAVA